MNRKGWGLFDIVATILIVAVLSAILCPVLAQAKQSSRDSTSMSQKRQSSAIEMYFDGEDENSIDLARSFSSNNFSPLGEELRRRPLVVNQKSRVVVMEYENWFGPNAVTFQGTAAKPFLQSPDMQNVGGGYDSADPKVIETHLRELEHLGVDAAMIETTNNVSCIFGSEAFDQKYLPGCTPSFRSSMRTILENTANTYPWWDKLRTRLKLIPLVSGNDPTVFDTDTDGKTALEKEISYFATRMDRYPSLNVIYEGKPLMVVYTGASQDPNIADDPLWYQVKKLLKAHPEIERKFTIRLMAGYLDSQPYLWKNQSTPTGPVELDSSYHFWSWVDRLNAKCKVQPSCPYFPSFNKEGSRVENLTAAIATAGQDGWGCPNANSTPYCPDDSLRYGANNRYVTFDSFMLYARKLDPIFLFVHQFNEFGQPDEGFDANTDDDIEPANLWGNDLPEVRRQIELYRRAG